VEVAGGVHEQAVRTGDTRVRGFTAVPAERLGAVPRDGRDGAGGIYLAHAVVAAVGDIEIARGVHGDVPEGLLGERRVRRLAAVSAEARLAVPRDGRDLPVRRDAADALVVEVRDIQVALRVHCQAVHVAADRRLGGGTAVAAVAGRADTGDH